MNYHRNRLPSRGPMPARSRWRTLARASDGATAIEFTLIAPVFCMMLMGVFDIGQMAYGNAVLRGAAQVAARGSSLETADTTAADNKVRSMVQYSLPGATVTTTRVSYYDFADINRPEVWNDKNANGTCDNAEGYTDENRNGAWDPDIGTAGNGGAGDVIVYTVTAEYTPVFKIPFAPSSWDKRKLTSTTVRKNQPFANQAEYGSAAGTCT